MDETIDPNAVILQLQLENEQLRNYMRGFEGIQHTVNAVPRAIEELWNKAYQHRYPLIAFAWMLYGVACIILMVYDRWHK